MKSVVLVNGVPASGKSTVAGAISSATGWPMLGLDTIKEALFNHVGLGDRDYNRTLGKASYRAIFALIGDFPEGSHAIVDAWFGFQPLDILEAHLAGAEISNIVEVWCHAPPEIIGERYAARVASRPTGHLGAEYVPELIDLAARARPTGRFPVLEVDSSHLNNFEEIVARVRVLLK